LPTWKHLNTIENYSLYHTTIINLKRKNDKSINCLIKRPVYHGNTRPCTWYRVECKGKRNDVSIYLIEDGITAARKSEFGNKLAAAQKKGIKVLQMIKRYFPGRSLIINWRGWNKEIGTLLDYIMEYERVVWFSDTMTGKQLTIVSINGPYRDEGVFTMMRLATRQKKRHNG